MRKVLLSLMVSALLFTAAAQQSTSPRTASYGLFPVENSGVRGNLQLTEDFSTGDLEAIVTLVGITAGQQFLPVVFAGTCGPDRPLVAELPPVGSFSNDPFVSIGHFDVSFDEVTQGEYFMFIFPGDVLPAENDAGNVDVSSAVACGQIGAGANR